MTTVVLLLLGFGVVLIISAIETNPDGSDVSVVQTVKDVWNDNLTLTQTSTTTTPTSSTSSTSSSSSTNQNTAGVEQLQSNIGVLAG